MALDNADIRPERSALLDLLIDGDSSFAAIYHNINKYYANRTAEPSYSVESVWRVVMDMIAIGLLHAYTDDAREVGTGSLKSMLSRYREWLPSARPEDVPHDSVGLWIGLTRSGHEEWFKSEGEQSPQAWMVEVDGVRRRIVVYAPDREIAMSVLERWSSIDRSYSLEHGACTWERVSEYRLRTGRLVGGGGRLTVPYK